MTSDISVQIHLQLPTMSTNLSHGSLSLEHAHTCTCGLLGVISHSTHAQDVMSVSSHRTSQLDGTVEYSTYSGVCSCYPQTGDTKLDAKVFTSKIKPLIKPLNTALSHGW